MLSLTNRKPTIARGLGLAFFLLTISVGAGLVLSVATARADEKANDELFKPFQGTWTTSGEGVDATWTFEGAKITASIAGMEFTCKAKIDKSAKPHATIDLTIVDGPEEAKGKTSKGIYNLEGDKLTVCITSPGREERPKGFTQIDDEAYMFELTKEKK